MDLVPAIFIGLLLLIAPIALDQHGQKMDKLSENGWKNTMLGRGSRPTIRRKPTLIGLGLAVVAWAVLIPIALGK